MRKQYTNGKDKNLERKADVKQDTILKCRKCGFTTSVDFVDSLRNGWVMCCGETMMLVKTNANVGKAVEKVIDCQVPRSRKNTL